MLELEYLLTKFIEVPMVLHGSKQAQQVEPAMSIQGYLKLSTNTKFERVTLLIIVELLVLK